MKIKDRIEQEADYIIKTKSTIRETAKVFKVSKSTVHKDMSEKLINVSKRKYLLVSDILKEHMETRHILGGESTKLKYEKLKNER